MSISTEQSNKGGHDHDVDVDASGDCGGPFPPPRLRRRATVAMSALATDRRGQVAGRDERARSERTRAAGDQGWSGDSNGPPGPGATQWERPEDRAWRAAFERRLRDLETGDGARGPDPEVARLLRSGAVAGGGGQDSDGAAATGGVVFEENAVPAGRGLLSNRASSALRLLGHSARVPQIDLDTKTINLYAVSVAVDASRSKAWKYFVACSTLLLVCAQGMAYSALMYEAAFPPCEGITDCPAGNFCHIYAGARPACVDCGVNDWLGACEDNYCDRDGNVIYHGYNYNSRPPLKLNQWRNITGFQETCSAIIRADIWEHREYYNADYSHFPLTGSKAQWIRRRSRLPDQNGEYEFYDKESHKKREYEDNFSRYLCLAANHCIQTDMDSATKFHGHCDYVVKNREQMDAANWLVIFFLTLLWILPICLDVEEAKLEEVVLDFYLRGRLDIPAELVRIALRIRIFVLPYLTTGATFMVIVTDNMTAKNIVLNFLAITFIIEADNMFAVLLLSSNHLKRMSAVANDVDEAAKETASATFFWTRAQGLACAVMMISWIYLSDILVGESCDELMLGSTLFFSVFLYLAVIGMRFCCIICGKNVNQTHCERFLAALTDACTIFSAVWVGTFIPLSTIAVIKNLDEFHFGFFSIACIGSLVWFLLVISLCAVRQKL